MARVLQNCKVIIWDECTMAHKRALEALDRTLKDLRSNQSLFGGTIILLAGDFRVTLPVIPRSTAVDEINACLKSSNLWKYVKTIKLTTNMQLTKSKDELIAKVFPNIGANHHNHAWLSERAILAARNKDVDYLNSEIQRQIDGQLYSFKSIDCTTDPDEAVNYPIEFLNSLDVPGIPPHNLQLKVGSVIIMLRNLNQPKLCNGTRLAVKKLMNNLIEATIITGKFKDEDVLIPRIPMIPTDLSFQFKRIQFPVRLAFAMTINESQGQSLEVCGINL
ncbi:GSCOCG00010529001-RA-CDS, partial [Cotesia congregata]